MSFGVVWLNNIFMLRLGQRRFCNQSRTRGDRVLMQQGEIHISSYGIALCLYAATPHCHKQRRPSVLVNTTIHVHNETVLL